jgi:hypothetical protein
MSGESLAYQLRQNKAVDRYAFLELLSKIDKFQHVSDYTYIGFGGHSLEDFKHIHARFGTLSMTSIESEEYVYKRQQFNRPHSCIDCTQKSSHDFITEFERENPTIIWLDYTNPSELRNQIEEFQATLDRLYPMDILKITLNANAASYGSHRENVSEVDVNQIRFDKLRGQLGEGDLFPLGSVKLEMMVARRFPHVLNLIVKYASDIAMKGREGLCFQPLTAFSYADGQTMLTVTGIILENALADDFFNKTSIKQWSLANTSWNEPKRINIPNLTVKERLHIDALLPCSDTKTIQHELGFLFDKKENISIEMLNNYSIFYRQSPYFSRVIF